ncbi:MAG: pyrophosphatase [Candidatus Moranbacteria bacterium RIFCSPLOWO2_02_FULL_48_19]|nr:MAG: pyrophosphatase [Candidatus Moranbacteria bacterium RIFCSPLOWO2_02_FULL_48_19]OGI31157.1 MAG: pyrophosphatase [Candidatus Moranbacteria bacterium RIFCSPLOWO2_12_FULL_48_12]
MVHRIRVATIITDNDKILLVKHVHPETKYEWWVPPGGGVEESDNSLFDCAKREVFEETNLTVEVSRIVYIREFLDKENQKLNIELFVLADSYHGDIGIENIYGNGLDEQYIKDVRWLSKEDLQGMIVFPEILKDEFWDDQAMNFPSTKYLGRHAG